MGIHSGVPFRENRGPPLSVGQNSTATEGIGGIILDAISMFEGEKGELFG